MKNKFKNAVFIVVVTIVAPFVLLLITEGIFRLAGWGTDYSPFRKVGNVFVDQPDFLSKYIPGTVGINNAIGFENIFDVEKKPNSLRVFLVGESTPQGFPYEKNLSFGKMLELALTKTGKYPKVEVINLGFSAQSSAYVSDLLPKLEPYEPDLILVYVGHNEYYGQFGEMSGSNQAWLPLYFALKEWYVFQNLFLLFEKDKTNQGENLMASRSSLGTAPLSDEREQRVSERLRANLDRSLGWSASKSIPLVIIEPISNLIDMPPFASSDSEPFDSDVEKFITSINELNKPEWESYLRRIGDDLDFAKLAINQYLMGHSLRILTKKVELDFFIAAKDRDSVPFRARTFLLETLKAWTIENKDRDVHFVPLNTNFFYEHGPESFGLQFFVDHVHFNLEGHRRVASYVFREVAKILELSQDQKSAGLDYLSGSPQLWGDLSYIPYLGLLAQSRIENMASQEPFTGMVFPMPLPYFRFQPDIWKADQENIDFVKEAIELKVEPITYVFFKLYNNYLQKGNLLLSKVLLQSFYQMNPGLDLSYLNIAMHLKEYNDPEWENFAVAAVLISTRPDEMLLSLKTELEKQNQIETWEKLDQKINDTNRNDFIFPRPHLIEFSGENPGNGISDESSE